MGNVANAARIAIVIASAALALGSASSNSSQPQQRGYYPRPNGPTPGPQPQALPQGQYSPCEYACGQISRCNLAPYATCLNACRQQRMEQQPGGADQLNNLSRQGCPQLAAQLQNSTLASQPAQPARPATGARQWSCTATGSWQRCANDGTNCSPVSAVQSGMGTSEAIARGAAETQCTSYMGGMMSASYAYKTSLVAACRSTTCVPM